MKNKANKKEIKFLNLSKGFNLIEIIIAIAIFGLIFGTVGKFARDVLSYNSLFENQLAAEESGRKVLNPMINEIRSASPSVNGAYPIEEAATSSFIFFSNIDKDASIERVRYFLSGTELRKGVKEPSGNPLNYNGNNEVVTTLIQNVRNETTSIFAYYDTNYTGTSSAMTFPLNITQIRLVKINVNIDKDVNKPPSAVTITSQVSIRNLKDNF